MLLEFKTVSLDFDETLERNVNTLAAEGWKLVDGKKPQVTYELCRASGGVGKFTIDESKILIGKPDGKFYDQEGNVVDYRG